MITPVAIDNLGYKYYVVYTCIGFTILPAVYYFYPEVRVSFLFLMLLLLMEILDYGPESGGD
jgi:hypothetical protein